MANFSTAASNTLSTTSSLSYHHLFSTSNGNDNNSNSTSPNQNIVQESIINDTNTHTPFDTNTDFSFSLPSTIQQTNLFDTVPSHFNNDSLVRQFFNYRQTDSNYTGNYYSNIPSGSFVNTFDYPYTSITPLTTNFGTNPAVPNHGFTSVSNTQQQHSYMPCHQHSQQQQQQQPQNIYP